MPENPEKLYFASPVLGRGEGQREAGGGWLRGGGDTRASRSRGAAQPTRDMRAL